MLIADRFRRPGPPKEIRYVCQVCVSVADVEEGLGGALGRAYDFDADALFALEVLHGLDVVPVAGDEDVSIGVSCEAHHVHHYAYIPVTHGRREEPGVIEDTFVVVLDRVIEVRPVDEDGHPFCTSPFHHVRILAENIAYPYKVGGLPGTRTTLISMGRSAATLERSERVRTSRPALPNMPRDTPSSRCGVRWTSTPHHGSS